MKLIFCDAVVDIQKLTYSALVLAMLFSTGEAVPLQYYGKLHSQPKLQQLKSSFEDVWVLSRSMISFISLVQLTVQKFSSVNCTTL